MTSASKRIASFAARAGDTAFTGSQRHLAYRAFLDTFAVAVAGQNDEACRIAGGYLREVTGIGKATAWISGASLPAESAAWLNAIIAHVLDYDDVMTPMRGHVSAVLVPALVALAQVSGADGERYSSAYIAGFEVMAKFSKVMAMAHYSRGWHSTSALGVIGAAAACSTLLGLDERQTMHALGLAVAQAAGSRQNFGTMAKSFQAGQCGAAAVKAALLAQAGFTSAADAIDGAYGYLALYGEREDLSSELETLGKTPLEIEVIGIDIKKYPCCYATHKALDSVLALREKHALTLEQVDSVDIVTSARGLEAVIHARPQNGLEGKFSMEYSVAAALADGRVQLSSFDDAQILRPAIQAFLYRITKRESSGDPLPRWVSVKLRLKSGATLEQRVDVARGDAPDPLSDSELIDKAQDCFVYGGWEYPARTFASQVFGMTDMPLNDLMRTIAQTAGLSAPSRNNSCS